MAMTRRRPTLSIVVVAHDMPTQAMRTLESLRAERQRAAVRTDYEVLVVENASERNLDEGEVRSLGPQFNYWLRRESGQSPAAACNEGLRRARGSFIGLMIDGARMVTPGTISGLTQAVACYPDRVIAVPGYHLGRQLQRDPSQTGHDEAFEASLLGNINWPADGYRLFDVAVLSGSCRDGFLLPMAESNLLVLPRRTWRRLRGIERRFQTPGGGFANLDLYRRANQELPGGPVILPGEGTFHQFHGGATTGSPELDRDQLMVEMADEYHRLRGGPYAAPTTPPTLHGGVTPQAARFLEFSAKRLRSGTTASG